MPEKIYTTSEQVEPAIRAIRDAVNEHFIILRDIVLQTSQSSSAENVLDHEISSIISSYARLLDLLEQGTDVAKPRIQKKVRKALGYSYP